MNFQRGSQKSVRYALLGFLSSVIPLGIWAVLYLLFFEIHPNDWDSVVWLQTVLILIFSVGLASMFALAAFASFTPEKEIPFIRSLSIISASMLFAFLFVPLGHHSFLSDHELFTKYTLIIASPFFAMIVILIFLKPKESVKTVTNFSTNEIKT